MSTVQLRLLIAAIALGGGALLFVALSDEDTTRRQLERFPPPGLDTVSSSQGSGKLRQGPIRVSSSRPARSVDATTGGAATKNADSDQDVDLAREEGRATLLLLDSASGAPLAGERFLLTIAGDSSRRPLSRVTDDEGRIALRDTPPGFYTVQLRHPDFVPTASLLDLSDPVEETSEHVIRLERGHRVTGRVEDELGDAIQGARVVVHRAAGESPDRRQCSTGTDGGFELTGLAPGEWALSAWAGGHHAQAPRPVETGLSDPIRIVLPRERLGSVRVLRPDGTPLLRARVSTRLAPAAPGVIALPATVTDELGQARLAGLPSEGDRILALTVRHRDYPTLTRDFSVTELMSGEVVLVVEEPQEINGVVVDEAGRAVRSARVDLDGAVSKQLSTTSQGEFVFRGLPPGPYVLRAATTDRGVSEPLTIDLTADPPPSMPIQLTLRRGTGILAGVVVDEQGEPMVLVAVRAEGAGGSIETATDSEGTFRLEGLEEGSYRLLAGSRQHGKAPEMEVSTSQENLLLRIAKPGSVFGFVSEAGPARGFSIEARREPTATEILEPARSYRFSSKEPRFLLEDMPPGRYRLLLVRAGHAEAEATGVEVLPGERTGPVILRVRK